MLDDTTGLLRPNAPGLRQEVADIVWDELIPWLEAGGDEEVAYDYRYWQREPRPAPRGLLWPLQALWRTITDQPQPMLPATACIGGRLSQLTDVAQLSMVVPEEQIDELFSDGLHHSPLPSGPQAASCVRHWMRTGIVDWHLAMRRK